MLIAAVALPGFFPLLIHPKSGGFEVRISVFSLDKAPGKELFPTELWPNFLSSAHALQPYNII